MQSVLKDLPVLHDDEEILLRIFDQRDVGGGIAIDDEKIGESALFEHAKLPGIGVAWPGQGEQFAIGRGGHLEDFGVLVPAREMRQHDPLPHGLLCGKQEIRAEGGLELEGYRQWGGCVCGKNDLEPIYPALTAKRNGVFFPDERL